MFQTKNKLLIERRGRKEMKLLGSALEMIAKQKWLMEKLWKAYFCTPVFVGRSIFPMIEKKALKHKNAEKDDEKF